MGGLPQRPVPGEDHARNPPAGPGGLLARRLPASQALRSPGRRPEHPVALPRSSVRCMPHAAAGSVRATHEGDLPLLHQEGNPKSHDCNSATLGYDGDPRKGRLLLEVNA